MEKQQVELAKWTEEDFRSEGVRPPILFRIQQDKMVGLAVCMVCGRNRLRVLKPGLGFEKVIEDDMSEGSVSMVVFYFRVHCLDCVSYVIKKSELDEVEGNDWILLSTVSVGEADRVVDLVEVSFKEVEVFDMRPNDNGACRCLRCKVTTNSCGEREQDTRVTRIDRLASFTEGGYAEQSIDKDTGRVVMASGKFILSEDEEDEDESSGESNSDSNGEEGKEEFTKCV
jgi:hypothetical protein